MGTGSVNSAEIMNRTVSSGTEYSDEIINHKRGGFKISTKANQGSGDLDAALSLESWDPSNGWIPEPKAVFEADPAGSAFASIDTFTETQAEKYRVGVTRNSGSGPVVMSVSMQTEE